MKTSHQLLQELIILEKYVIDEIQDSVKTKKLDGNLHDLLKTNKILIAEKLFRHTEFFNNFKKLQEKYKEFSQHQILRSIDIVNLDLIKIENTVNKACPNWALLKSNQIDKPSKGQKKDEALLIYEIHYQNMENVINSLKTKFEGRFVLKQSLFYKDLLESIDGILSTATSYTSELTKEKQDLKKSLLIPNY